MSVSSSVPFIGVGQMSALVNRTGVEAFVLGLVDYLETDYARWTTFEKSPRYATHSLEGVIELMPINDEVNFGFKYVNGHPKNMKDGLQTVVAFGVLSDVGTGYPIMVSEMTLLTALRTAAMSAMVAKHLAPANATALALIGNGAQSEFQALAFKAVLDIGTVRLYDVDPAATQKCMANLQHRGLEIIACRSAEEAVQGAQIITTCTADKKNATILTDNMVGSGVHINAIGGDCPGKTEIHADILRRADIFVEYAPQTRIEGDIQQLDDNHPVTEFWEVLSGAAPGRVGGEQTTLFDCVGFAIEDFSALRFVYDRLASMQDVPRLDLLADPPDPRNLFGMTQSDALPVNLEKAG